MTKIIIYIIIWLSVFSDSVHPQKETIGLIRPGDLEFPVAWTTYRKVASMEEDAADLKAHGIGLIGDDVMYKIANTTIESAQSNLKLARRTGLKYQIDLPDITQTAQSIRNEGLEPVDAVMIGGVYQGKAVDRHLFNFTADRHEIIVEPPVYRKGLIYQCKSCEGNEHVGHYFPDMPAPLRAEIVVPLRLFDGKQHLRIVPAMVTEAPSGTRLEFDSTIPEERSAAEIKNRKLYTLNFDLTGLDGAMLDHVGIAVFWNYKGTDKYPALGQGDISAWAETTRKALRQMVNRELRVWAEANGGTFPSDVVLAARYGDEGFWITGHLNSSSGNYPLREYSEPSLKAFTTLAGVGVAYPRTWGFPEVYGEDAYAWWLYNLHRGCADLISIVQEEIAKVAPDVMLFRNTTRAGVWAWGNDHDGSGQELLTSQLDIVHLDPYPITAKGYDDSRIPIDMSYCGGLARRYHRLLIPWMQAHSHVTGLTHPTPEQIDRMAEQQWMQGVDGIKWLGYGGTCTFPNVNPDSWERAATFHARLAKRLPTKPKAELAVLRPYRTWALSSLCEDKKVRNPADWMLQQFLYVWAVKYGRAYDIFELPPSQSPNEEEQLETALREYKYIVSTEPQDGVWVIGVGTEGQAISLSQANEIRQQMENQLKERDWLSIP